MKKSYMKQLLIYLYFALVAALITSCTQQGTLLVIDENAPAQVMINATIQHTDSGRLQMVMWGEEIWNFDDEDETQEFPSNVKATFYDEFGNMTTIITANEGTNRQRKQLMNLRGNVIIQDLRDGKRTYTEDFWWDQDKGEIYSDVPVKQVWTCGTIQRGTAFRADEQMHNWDIRNPRFTFSL